MSLLQDILDRLRSLEPEKALGLRPPYPPVVIQAGSGEGVLVRLRRRRRGRPMLEAHHEGQLPAECIPASIFQPAAGAAGELAEGVPHGLDHQGIALHGHHRGGPRMQGH